MLAKKKMTFYPTYNMIEYKRYGVRGTRKNPVNMEAAVVKANLNLSLKLSMTVR